MSLEQKIRRLEQARPQGRKPAKGMTSNEWLEGEPGAECH